MNYYKALYLFIKIKDLLFILFPNNVSMEDIIEAIYVRQKIKKGLKDSEEGRVYTHDEAKEILKKWLE